MTVLFLSLMDSFDNNYFTVAESCGIMTILKPISKSQYEGSLCWRAAHRALIHVEYHEPLRTTRSEPSVEPTGSDSASTGYFP